MKLTVLLLLAVYFQVSAKVEAQTVTYSAKNVSLERALNEVTKQTGYEVLYNSYEISRAGKLSIDLRKTPLKQALYLIFIDKPLTYSIVRNVVVIRKKVNKEGQDSTSILPDLKEVHGTVLDSTTNSPLIGVTIEVKGSTIGTTTGNRGDFSLEVPDNAVLIFSYLGYNTREVPVNGRSTINVRMSSTVSSLNQVVVVGYGTQKVVSLTGSVSTVGASKLETMPNANLGSRLQGRVSGVTVVDDGSPGGTPVIRIRGYGSINNNNPLYVVDGVPLSGGLDNIDPNDIESISILKDASTAAIYGSRASNGVVLITTKQGKAGKTKVTLNVRYGFQNFRNNLKLMSPTEAADANWLQFKNDGFQVGEVGWGNATYGFGPTPVLPDYLTPAGGVMASQVDTSLYSWPRPYYGIAKANKKGTNWFNVIRDRNAPIQNYNLGVSGGSERGNYAFSAGYMDQAGTVLYTDYKRYSLRINANGKIGNWLVVGENLGVSYDNRLGFGNQDDLNPIAMAGRMSPLDPVYDIKGNFYGGYQPLWLLYTNKDNFNKNVRIIGDANAQINFLKDFSFKTWIGVDNSTTRNQDRSLIQYQSTDAAAENVLTQSYNGGLQYNWDNTLTYNKTIKNDHNINVLIGTEYVNNYSEEFSGSAGGYPFTNPNYMVLNAGKGDPGSSGTFDQWITFSYFGRLNYNYKEKYLFEAVVRRDGSSRFMSDKRWGTFPSFSAGWRISKEPFMDNVNWINDLKIRAGYGTVGNDNVGDYNIYSTYRSNINESYYNIAGTSHTSSEAGYHLYALGNPNARWETGTTQDIGIDGSFFNDNLGVSLDLYRRKTTNMLFPVSLPAVYGQVVAPSVNVGSMLNEGYDLQVTYHHTFSKNFALNVTGTASHYKNEVLNLNNNPNEILFGAQLRGDSYTATEAGHPISSFYGYVVDGIFNTQEEVDKWPKYSPDVNGNDSYSRPGVLKFKDVNGDGIINSADRTFIGSPIPKLTYGLDIALNYKNWDFDVFSQGVYGNEILDFAYWSNFSAFPLQILYTQSWTEQRYQSGAKITIPILSRNMTIDHLPSSFFLKNGSYLRVKSLEIGYTVPDKTLSRIKVFQGLRVYAQATNLFTITKYPGLNPEIIQINDLANGIDDSEYPAIIALSFGLNVNF